MKIVTWNCAGKFREDYSSLIGEDSDIRVDADIYVIQECENPDEDLPKYKKYKELVGDLPGNNYFWIGDIHYKGLGIFAKEDVKLEEIETSGDFKHFKLFRVNDSFDLLCVWAMNKDKEIGLNPYVEMIHDFFEANEDKFNENLIMCGDFNSNNVFNKKHQAKDSDGNPKDHKHLNEKLNEKGLYSVYHELSGEENGEETQFTFFQARHLNDPYHLDYVYANKEIIKNTTLTKNGKKLKDLPNEFEILDKRDWISLSDHLPVVFKFE